MPETDLASQVSIKINGTEIQRDVLAKLAGVTVDQHVYLPWMFIIRLNDPGLVLLDRGPFDLTKEIEISAAKQDGSQVTLIKGEITGIEPEFKEGMISEIVVRGYDKSHRLYRDPHTRAFLNTKDSDLAAQIAQSAGLRAEVETTRTVYDHIFQHNQTDLDFLIERAWRIGFECFVSEGKLYFRKPPAASSPSTTLTWGDDLQTFRVRMTLAEQVDEVQVKGWDVEKKSGVVGKAENGGLYPKIGEPKKGSEWARTFGSGKKIITNLPTPNQSEADILAAARMDEVTGAFIEAEGSAIRRPDIQAGKVIKIEALGNRLSGDYLVTSAVHTISPAGLNTVIHVRGSRTGSLVEQLARQRPGERFPGVVVGIVTNTDDPKNWGRVKVKFPWMADDTESDWARVLGFGAGADKGMLLVPDVGDEVIVAFLQGDFNHPVVLGGVWNGQDSIPSEVSGAGNGEKPLVRVWRSKTGHKIVMYDNSDKKIEVKTADGLTVTLDDTSKTIKLEAPNVSVKLENNKLTIESSSDVSIKSSANIKLEASGNLDIQASGQVNIKGSMVNLN